MTHNSVAKAFLKAHLPEHLTQRIRWDTLLPTKSSFILEESFRYLHSDLVYICTLDNQASLYLIVEHQSTPDPTIASRMFRYSHAIMNYHLQQGHKQFPTIAGICLYAGKKSPYTHSVRLEDCFEDPISAQRVHGIRSAEFITLVDITLCSEEALAQNGDAGTIEILLKQGQKKDFLDWTKKRPRFIRSLVESTYGHIAILYILATERKHSAKELLGAITSLIPEKRTNVMSAAQKLVQEGMEKGIAKGIKEGKLHIARSMLSKQLDKQLIYEITGLQVKDVAKLGKEVSKHTTSLRSV